MSESENTIKYLKLFSSLDVFLDCLLKSLFPFGELLTAQKSVEFLNTSNSISTFQIDNIIVQDVSLI